MKASNYNVDLVVDGMTGVGKSSLVKLLARRMRLTPFEEIFRDRYDLLSKFFADRKRWAFPMQVFFLSNRFVQYKQACEAGPSIMDRSIYSDHIFARMYYEEGYLTEEEYGVYQSLSESLLQDLSPPSLMVYLKVSLEEALRRIRQRGREDELQVEELYWKKLLGFYEDRYSNYTGELMVIDVSGLDFVHRPEDEEYIFNQIRARAGKLLGGK